MVVLEEEVLEPISQSDQDPDNWPNFCLTKCNVVSQSSGKQVSLLSAHKGNLVKVIGQLEEVEDDLLHLVRDKHYQKRTIELENISVYAFAEYEDGSYGFWAAGKAGWFEFTGSSSSYQSLYDEMVEAASMLYMLADKLRRAINDRPKQNPKEIEYYSSRIFRDYLSRGSIRLNTVQDVRKAFHGHRVFLMSSMLEGQEGLNWVATPMYNYFKLKFPDDFHQILSRFTKPSMAPKDEIQKEKKKIPPDVAANDDIPGKKKRKSQSLHLLVPQPKQSRGRPRKDAKPSIPRTPVRKSATDATSSEDEAYGNPNVITRKRKSILQPSGGKYSKKAKKGAGRRKDLPSNGESMADASDDNESSGGILDPEESPIIIIKNAEHLEDVTNPPRSRTSSSTPPPKFLPRKYLELKVADYEIPSLEPQGPGDLWTCTFSGCFHRVHRASTVDGKKRIKEHLRTHAKSAQEKIDLVIHESRPYLPVNNLVRRLQAFAPEPGVDPGPDSLQRKFSAPIRRKY